MDSFRLISQDRQYLSIFVGILSAKGGWRMEKEKGIRLLYLYRELISGRGIQKRMSALQFGVNERSIQRD